MNKKPSVIIIDDDEDLLEVTSTYLELRGVEVKGKGHDGCDAEKLYLQTCPDFVLLDMKMPKYDGAYAIQKIKEQDPNAKIIVTTGYADHLFEKNDVEKILMKPYDLKILLQEIVQPS